MGICTSFHNTRETSYKRDDIFDMVFIYNHLLFVLSILLLTTKRSSAEGADQSGTRTLSLEKSIVWGPGLKSRFSLPVRYFFIQTVDQFGEKYVLFFLLSFNIKAYPPPPPLNADQSVVKFKEFYFCAKKMFFKYKIALL